MSRINPVVYVYLMIWGTCQNKRTGLEYPSITAEARLLHSPGRSTKQHRSPSYEPDAADVTVQRAMSKISRTHQDVLDMKYKKCLSNRLIGEELLLSEWKTRALVEKSIEEISKALNIPLK